MCCFMELTRRSCLNTSGMIYSEKRMTLSFCLPGRKKNPDNPVNPVKKTKNLSVLCAWFIFTLFASLAPLFTP